VNARLAVRGRCALLLLGVAALAGCGGSGQSGSAFVFLSVDLFSVSGSTPVSNVNSNLGDRQATTSVCVTLRNNPKNPTVTSPSPLDNVTVTQYTTTIQRFDGGPAPGPFTFNTAFIVPAGTVSGTPAVFSGNTARVAVVLMPAQAKNEPPLFPRPAIPLNAVATVVFKGRDGRGQDVEAQGAVSLTFIFDQENAETPPSC
jgi:hypothetical protein